MSTISIAEKVKEEEKICQGDIFQNVKYTFISDETDDNVEVTEMVFPYAIIISQACDVISMEEMILKGEGKPTKFMPAILMCPIYDSSSAKTGNHIVEAFSELEIKYIQDNVFSKDDQKVANKDWHYRFHPFTVQIGEEKYFEDTIIDYKHYFTVPMSYLVNNKKNRIMHLGDLYAEQITLKFATYLTRVAIP